MKSYTAGTPPSRNKTWQCKKPPHIYFFEFLKKDSARKLIPLKPLFHHSIFHQLTKPFANIKNGGSHLFSRVKALNKIQH